MRGVPNKRVRLITAWMFLLAIVVNGFGHSFALPNGGLPNLAGLGLPQEVLASICISQPEESSENSQTNGCDNCRLTSTATLPACDASIATTNVGATILVRPIQDLQAKKTRDHLIARPRGPPDLI